MDLSIVIACTRPGMVKNCLDAFAAQTGNAAFEVIVAGNISGLRATSANVKFLEVQETHPNAKRNAGMQHAIAPLVALMDDDALPCADWVQTALHAAWQHPDCVITGPELPYPASGTFATLSHRILSSSLAEFTKGHIHSAFEPVQWHDVPFCNCVFPKSMWQQRGGFDTNIPWHMDDFHFFFPLRAQVQFLNIPALTIQHDRYPGSLWKLAQYKWRLRRETGEKLIEQGNIYWAVAPVKYAVIGSLSAAALFITLLLLDWRIAAAFTLLYLLLAFGIALKTAGAKPANAATGFAIIITVHFLTIAALYFGMVKALLRTGTKQ